MNAKTQIGGSYLNIKSNNKYISLRKFCVCVYVKRERCFEASSPNIKCTTIFQNYKGIHMNLRQRTMMATEFTHPIGEN